MFYDFGGKPILSFVKNVFPGFAEKPGNQTGMFPGFGISQKPLRCPEIPPEPEYLSLVLTMRSDEL